MKPRPLTPDEIDEILIVFQDYYKGLPSFQRNKLLELMTTPIRKELENIQLIPGQFGNLKREVALKFKPIESGKAVGIITGQSVGENSTQSKLNTFHTAGKFDTSSSSGQSRVLELICTTKSSTQSTPRCRIYFKDPFISLETQLEYLRSLIYIKFDKLIQRYDYFLQPIETEPWEEMFCHHFSRELFSVKIRYFLNIQLLYKFQITLESIAEIIEREFEDVRCVFSPLYMGILDVYFPDLSEGSTETLEYLEHTAHGNITATHIAGIKGIENAIFFPLNPLEEHPEGEPIAYYCETDGTDLLKILKLPFVDSYKTYSNDVWEIYNLFGIEAVGELLVEEFTEILPGIHPSHIKLLTDRMRVSGKLRSITRYTRKNENSSVISKASFEEPLASFSRAALYEEKDDAIGCSASIICGKIPRMGTGMTDFFYDEEVVGNSAQESFLWEDGLDEASRYPEDW